MTPTSNVLFPQQLGPITLPKTISILFVSKSINAFVVKPALSMSGRLIILVRTLLLIIKRSKSLNAF